MTKSKPSTVTIRDVAVRAGVSVATVSRFINRNAPVAQDTAQRLEQVMADLNYMPHATARKLAMNRTNTVGLLLMDISGDFFTPLLSGIEATTSELGYDLLISSTRRPERRKISLPPLGSHNTDGLLVFANSLGEEALHLVAANDFPLVLIHYSSPNGLKIPTVTVENKSASQQIVEHLIVAHKRERIVFLRGHKDQEDSYWRELGYELALKHQGLPYLPELVAEGGFNRQIAARSIEKLLKSGIEFDGVFCGDDEAAMGVLSALHRSGVSVPEHVSVVGFDDLRMAPFLNPPLTTVRAPTEEVGHVAARLLIDRIEGREIPGITLLPTEIIIRQSCGCNP